MTRLVTSVDPLGGGVQVCADTDGHRCWVRLHGALDLVSAPHLQQALNQLCRDGYPDIVLDLSGLEFLGAAGLTVFHQVHDQLRGVNGRLILHRPRRLARHMLAVTGLDTVLTIQPATCAASPATTSTVAPPSSLTQAAGNEPSC